MDDASRRALRDLARRAEWSGHPGASGAAQDAAALRDLGAELRAALIREPDQDASTWAYQSVERLSGYALKARADWTPEQIAELARLRENAVIALAPAPGESDAVPPPQRDPRRAALPPSLAAALRSRPVLLVVVGCLVLVALVLTLPRVLGGKSSADTPTAASSTAVAAPTTATSPTPTSPAGGTPSPSTASPATSPAGGQGPSSTADSSTSHVTAIQITNKDVIPGNPPEVILSYTVTASGTADVLITTTVDGSVPAQLSASDPDDESGQTTYTLTETINLSPWCGRGSVVVDIASGSVTQPATIPVSGC